MSATNTNQGDQPVGEGEAEDENEIHAHAQRADHLRVVAGGAHGRAEVCPEEQVEHQAGENDQPQYAHQHRGIAHADGPTEDVEVAVVGVEQAQAERFGLAGERGFIQQRHVAFAHDVKVH